MKAIVIGGGIGGLSAAIGLRRIGADVVLLERAARLEAAGAGLSLAANAMHALELLGVRDAVVERGMEAVSTAILTPAGRVLNDAPSDLVAGGFAVHRADLQAALLSGDERLGCEVVGATEDGLVTIADGREERGDVVVAADGLQSAVRRALFPAAAPRYAGYTAWRGVAPLAIESGRWQES